MKDFGIKTFGILFSIFSVVIVGNFFYSRNKESNDKYILVNRLIEIHKSDNHSTVFIKPTNHANSLVNEPVLINDSIKTKELTYSLSKSNFSDLDGKGRFFAIKWECRLEIKNEKDSVSLIVRNNGIHPLFTFQQTYDSILGNSYLFYSKDLTSKIEEMIN